jgi:NAD(P)-dependent dehydrogenase (short-subunit alcohol dehydrogenase family)
MADAGHGGLIINIASVAGLVGLNNRASYCASKGGLVLLTKAAAMDLAPAGVRVVAICPGFVNTTMTLDDAQEFVSQHVPLSKSGNPDDIAQAVVDLTRWNIATGSMIVLDGGLTAGFKW